MAAISKRPIGIFDSGAGGLTVMKEVVKVLPGEHIIYFGDTARVPYGNKSIQSILRFSTESVLFLLKKKVKLVVMACNTSSSVALGYLKNTFSVPLVGVIDPAVEKAVRVSKQKKIGVIGTTSTVRSGVYERNLKEKNPRLKVYSKACPLFVPFVEEGITGGPIVKKVVEMYLKEFKGTIDTLILGCTHYPVLKKLIASYLGGVRLVDSAREVAFNIKALLTEYNLSNNETRAKREFYVSDEPANFSKLAKLFLGETIRNPKVVNV